MPNDTNTNDRNERLTLAEIWHCRLEGPVSIALWLCAVIPAVYTLWP
jgi:hypothetical protein